MIIDTQYGKRKIGRLFGLGREREKMREKIVWCREIRCTNRDKVRDLRRGDGRWCDDVCRFCILDIKG